MKFSTKEDIDAPIETVFQMLSDFEKFERSAMRRGADVQRTDSRDTPGVGMCWEAQFKMRGRRRKVMLELVEYDIPLSMVFDATSDSLSGTFSLELLALSRTRTRLSVELEFRPLTLAARLWVQSMKLAKSNLTKRFKMQVASFTREMEERVARGG